MKQFLRFLILPSVCALAFAGPSITPAFAAVDLKSWTASPWNATSGVTSFSGTVTDPAHNGGTSATFTFAAPKTGVNVTAPADPDFAAAANSFFGFETSGFGVGDSGLGRFTRGESFTLRATRAFQLKQIAWREFTGDEVLHISWTNAGAPYELLYNVSASPSVLPSSIVADANTAITVTNVSASTANLSGRLRFEVINVALVNDPVAAAVAGSSLILMNWQSSPWNGASGVTSFAGAYTAPENGGTAATFTFNNAKTGVNVTVPEAPNFSAAVSSYFGFESTGFGVGNSTVGRFERGESFVLQCTHRFLIEEINWKEFTGDEQVHIRWTSGGVTRQQVFAVNAARYLFADLVADANTQVVFTNVSASTANLSGRLRFNYIATALVFNAEPVYDPSGPDGFQQMFGVNLAGGEFPEVLPGTYGVHYIYPNAQEMDYYKSKGLTLIRLPFRWERVQSTLNGALNSTEMTRIDNVINMAAARGMKVILDMHNYARRSNNIIGSSALPNSTFKDVWRKLADRYKTQAAIYGYGIMNEPHDTGGLWPAAAQAAADGIREVDTTHWIIVGGDGWSGASGWAGNNPNLNVIDPQGKLMYEAHCYFDSNSDGDYGTYAAEGGYPNIGVVRVSPFIEWLKARGARGFLGEYGVPKDDPQWNVALDRFLSHLYANGLSGAYWAGGPWWGDYPLSCEPTSNFTVDAPQMSVLQNYGQ